MTLPLLKIYGERNTGTRYLRKLIKRNLDVKILPGVLPDEILKLKRIFRLEPMQNIYFYLTFYRNLGWKHMLVKNAEELRKYSIISRNLSFVTITKNPYSWLLSLHRRPYHHNQSLKQDFETFLSSPWKTVACENAPEVISSPVELWNIKNHSYLQIKSHLPTLNIKYENLVNDPEKIMRLLGKSFSYNWKVEQFENHEPSTKYYELPAREKHKTLGFYRDYYLNEKWKEKLSPHSISIINDLIDDNLMNYFEYRKLA